MKDRTWPWYNKTMATSKKPVTFEQGLEYTRNDTLPWLVQDQKKSRSKPSTKFPGLLKIEERSSKCKVTGKHGERKCVSLMANFFGTFSLYLMKDVQTGEIIIVKNGEADLKTGRLELIEV